MNSWLTRQVALSVHDKVHKKEGGSRERFSGGAGGGEVVNDRNMFSKSEDFLAVC